MDNNLCTIMVNTYTPILQGSISMDEINGN